MRAIVISFWGVLCIDNKYVLTYVHTSLGRLPQHALYSLLGGNPIPGPSVFRGFVSFLSVMLAGVVHYHDPRLG